jgi:hypothetical protein
MSPPRHQQLQGTDDDSLLELFFAGAQLLLRLLAIGDILDHANEADHFPGFIKGGMTALL